MGVML